MNTETATNENLGPATETVVIDFPALDVVKRTGAFGKPVRFVAEERLGLLYNTARHGTLVKEFVISSVASSALKRGECPMRAVDRAKANGHCLHFVFPVGTSITAWKQAKRRLVQIEIGMVFIFEGRKFEVCKGSNSDNLNLREIPTTEFEV
jgi:hypothetical protein